MSVYKCDKDFNIIECYDTLEWASWFENSDKDRIVAKDDIKGIVVSTVFLGLSVFSPRTFFETMIFGGKYDGHQWRYENVKDARIGHKEAVDLVTLSQMKTIKFYSSKGNYGCFSNFSRHPINLKGRVWITSEHYFQAMKFEGTKHEEFIRSARSPMEAAKLGRDRKKPLRPDWESVKDNIMREAVLAKFTQHDDIRQVLLSTEDAILIEHTTNDSYWGDGGDGRGKNMLGTILMEVREKFKEGK